MKTLLKVKWLLGGLLILAFLHACSKDELEPTGPDPTAEAPSAEARKNYNNGVIKSYANATVLAWNQVLSEAVDDNLPPPAEAKIYAMVSLAMHDALNGIIPRYEGYALDNSAVSASSVNKDNVAAQADAAVSQAAYSMLTALFPPSQEPAAALLESTLAGITDAELKALGITVGQSAAQAILAKRQNDQPIAFTSYDMGTEAGIHQSNYMPFAVANPNPPFWPQNAVYGANLGAMEPFGMATADQFRATPPYEITSPEYAADHEEVRLLGCPTCPDRTSEQTEIGAFWIENVSSSTNRVARHMAVTENLDGWETARLLALVQIAQIDANISSFEGKYHYNFWRPITAIQAGESDGNPGSAGNPDWTSTFVTPPTPEYPSTHSCAGGAGSELLKLYFKKDKISMTVTSPYYLPGVERKLTTFTQIGRENALSRIYIGFHFRKAIDEGERTGRQLGAYVFKNSLKELKK